MADNGEASDPETSPISKKSTQIDRDSENQNHKTGSSSPTSLGDSMTGDSGKADVTANAKAKGKKKIDPNDLLHGLGVKKEDDEKHSTKDDSNETKATAEQAVKQEKTVNKEPAGPSKSNKKQRQNKIQLGVTPYPDLERPTKEECYEVNRLLTELHGKVKPPENIPIPSRTVAGCGQVKFILEALVRTYISSHTSMTNANNAIQGLLKAYPTIDAGPYEGSVNWMVVLENGAEKLENAIRRGGMAPTKSKSIIKILEKVKEENEEKRRELKAQQKKEGSVKSDEADDTKAAIMTRAANQVLLEDKKFLTLDYLHSLPAPEVFEKLQTYQGIGPKTAACVLLFCMQRPCFAVDTHVFRLCGWLGWVPEKASRESTFSHCDVRVPDELKYSLHQLMIAHGKSCPHCKAGPGKGGKDLDEECVLDHLVDRSGKDKPTKKQGGKPKGKKVKTEAPTVSEDDESNSDVDTPVKKKKGTAAKKEKGSKTGQKEEPPKKAAKSISKKRKVTGDSDVSEDEKPNKAKKAKAGAKNTKSANKEELNEATHEGGTPSRARSSRIASQKAASATKKMSQTTPGKKLPKSTARPKAHRATEVDSTDSSVEEELSEESSELSEESSYDSSSS